MLDFVEELAKRRAYRLKYNFTKCHCGRSTVILLHRTDAEFGAGKRNVKQWCGVYDYSHVTRPKKKCTVCGNQYEQEQDFCVVCEPKVRELTELEVSIINSRAEILRLGRQLKRKRITDADYTRKVQILNEKIEKDTRKLSSLPTL